MKKIKWDKLLNNIPSKLQVKNKVFFEVLRVQEFASDHELHGETRFDPNQIVLAEKWGTKEKVHTFFHEAIHAFSDAYEIGLTEKQVQRLEKSLPYWIKLARIMDGQDE